MIDIKVQEGIQLTRLQAESRKAISIDRRQILFIFSDLGKAFLNVPNIEFHHEIQNDVLYTFANPKGDSVVYFEFDGDTEVSILSMDIKSLHSFFGVDFGSHKEDLTALMAAYSVKNYVSEKELNPSLKVVFHQLFSCNLQGLSKELFYKGKIMEFFSLYMHNPSRKREFIDSCPFVEDHLEVEKIREARKIITERYSHPPSLKELAREVGTNEFKLKVGFKSLYGNTVNGYLTDFRLETARKMLESSNQSIKEIAHHIGYSNPSHFIAYYKKKFGVTPKQYIKSRI